MKFLSAVFSKARGSIGGTTFSQNANGAYTRAKSRPTNRNSFSQQAVRAIFTGLSSSWKALSDTDKQSYTDRAPEYPYINTLGETKQYTGSQLYKKLNGQLAQIGMTLMTNCLPAVVLVVPAFGGVETDTSAVTMRIIDLTFTDGNAIVPPDFQLCVDATVVTNGGVTAPKKAIFRRIATFPNSTSMASVDVKAAYEAVFGTGWESCPDGYKIFFAFKCVNTTNGQTQVATLQIPSTLTS